MSHSVHPYSFRIGTSRSWRSRWFRVRNYQELLKADVILRDWLEKRLRGLYISGVEIERGQNTFNLIIRTSRPGLIIGRGGEGVEKLKREIQKLSEKNSFVLPKDFKVSIEEVRSPETHAKIVAQLVAEDLEKRLPFRRIIKQTLEKIMANKSVKGAKISLSGRLGGAEMARYEWQKRGQIPLTTLRADVDFTRERAHLPYGDIGIKVWIYKGEIFSEKQKEE